MVFHFVGGCVLLKMNAFSFELILISLKMSSAGGGVDVVVYLWLFCRLSIPLCVGFWYGIEGGDIWNLSD